MKTTIRLVFAAALVAMSAACTTPAAGTRQMASVSKEDLVCRKDKVTGTRIAGKTCKTAAAWAEFDKYTEQNAKEQTDKFQRLNTGCSTQAEFGCM